MAYFKLKHATSYSIMLPSGKYLSFVGGQHHEVKELGDIAYLDGRADMVERCNSSGSPENVGTPGPRKSYTLIGNEQLAVKSKVTFTPAVEETPTAAEPVAKKRGRKPKVKDTSAPVES